MKKVKSNKTAVLVLESGLTLYGNSNGIKNEKFGEVVFNTSMTGYQEVLTDPSYKGQIILMTEPHIGNVGVNDEDMESHQIFCEGLIIREASPIRSNWRSQETLFEFLKSRGIPAISGLDTRFITKHIREQGAMRGVISTIDFNPDRLLKKVKNSPHMSGRNLVDLVTCQESYEWKIPEWQWNSHQPRSLTSVTEGGLHVVVMDLGVKKNILRCLTDRGCRVTVVSAKTSEDEILDLKPDGIMLSNGPGDPSAVTGPIDTIRKLIRSEIPLFGICLGHQLLSHALGGRTYKLKFGHRGANHPVKNIATGKIEITAQNHGFCVDSESLADKGIEMSHINLNDKTLEGFRHKTLPIFSVQYHPESSAGPHDSRYLFDEFIKLMKETNHSQIRDTKDEIQDTKYKIQN